MIRYRYLLAENATPILRDSLNRMEPEITLWRVGDPGVPENGTPGLVILE